MRELRHRVSELLTNVCRLAHARLACRQPPPRLRSHYLVRHLEELTQPLLDDAAEWNDDDYCWRMSIDDFFTKDKALVKTLTKTSW